MCAMRQAKTKAKPKGRKPRDLKGECSDWFAKLHSSQPSTAIFWGLEAKVGMKAFENLNKDVQARIQKAAGEEEVDSLRPLLKGTLAIHRVLRAASEHGLRSDGFKKEFDKQT
eukprot:8513222-Karenia_brevis.AAC.1